MKDMVRDDCGRRPRFKTSGYVPPRDLIFAFMSHEEPAAPSGRNGWWRTIRTLRRRHGSDFPRSAASPFSLTTTNAPTWSTAAEKGVAWATLTATGRAGHGSFVNDDNRRQRIAKPSRPGRARVPIIHTATVDAFFASITELTGMEFPRTIWRVGGEDRHGVPDRTPPCGTPQTPRCSRRLQGNVIPSTARRPSTAGSSPARRTPSGTRWRESSADGVEIREWQPPLEFPFEGDLSRR